METLPLKGPVFQMYTVPQAGNTIGGEGWEGLGYETLLLEMKVWTTSARYNLFYLAHYIFSFE